MTYVEKIKRLLREATDRCECEPRAECGSCKFYHEARTTLAARFVELYDGLNAALARVNEGESDG